MLTLLNISLMHFVLLLMLRLLVMMMMMMPLTDWTSTENYQKTITLTLTLGFGSYWSFPIGFRLLFFSNVFFENVAVGVVRKSQKIFMALVYRAHCTVIFAIAQLSYRILALY